MSNSDKTTCTGYTGNVEELLAQVREACKDIADWRPDYIEMRPEYYNYLVLHSEYMTPSPRDFTPYYYGIRVEVNEELDKPYRIMRGGEEVSE